MKAVKQKVKDLCDEVYNMQYSQIIIDMVQNEIEELLQEENPSRDSIGAMAYDVDILREVYDKSVDNGNDWLIRMYEALKDWSDDTEQNNILLGIPREQ